MLLFFHHLAWLECRFTKSSGSKHDYTTLAHQKLVSTHCAILDRYSNPELITIGSSTAATRKHSNQTSDFQNKTLLAVILSAQQFTQQIFQRKLAKLFAIHGEQKPCSDTKRFSRNGGNIAFNGKKINIF